MNAMLIYSLASAVGQNFIYYMITQFGPLELTAVTTVRKIFTTLYSVFRNPSNRLTELQWVGCGLVFVSRPATAPARRHRARTPPPRPPTVPYRALQPSIT